MTLMSRDSPPGCPSGGAAFPVPPGAACTVAAPAPRTAASTTEMIVATQGIPARIAFTIEFLALKLRREGAATLDQTDKTDLKPEEGRGNERVRRTEREPSCVDRREIRPHGSGRRRRDKINRASGVMAERKTNLAIVVRQGRRRMARWAGRQDSRRAARRKRYGVVVPTEQRSM